MSSNSSYEPSYEQPPAMPPTLSRSYKAYCEGCGATCYVSNSDRLGGICYECENEQIVIDSPIQIEIAG